MSVGGTTGGGRGRFGQRFIIGEFACRHNGCGLTFRPVRRYRVHFTGLGGYRFGIVLFNDIVGEDGSELPTGQPGQVWFETPAKFEYHGDPAKTAQAFNDRGWSTLGDIGMVDDEGYLYITDRVSNMVISGGVNIYPREIEDVLVGHPDVVDVAVVGVPDPDLGEAVRAVVEPSPGRGASPAFATELIEYCRGRLSAFKCPRSVVFLDELPRLPTGKLAKRMLPAAVLTAD